MESEAELWLQVLLQKTAINQEGTKDKLNAIHPQIYQVFCIRMQEQQE